MPLALIHIWIKLIVLRITNNKPVLEPLCSFSNILYSQRLSHILDCLYNIFGRALVKYSCFTVACHINTRYQFYHNLSGTWYVLYANKPLPGIINYANNLSLRDVTRRTTSCTLYTRKVSRRKIICYLESRKFDVRISWKIRILG